jgi:hypothetical protein
MSEPKYRPGQVWAYENRKSEPLSTFTVLKVWIMKSGASVVHIAIDDVFVTDANGGELGTSIPHLPFRRDALDRSVTDLVQESSRIPDFVEEYDDWLREQGGIFACTVAEALGVMEVALRHGGSRAN